MPSGRVCASSGPSAYVMPGVFPGPDEFNRPAPVGRTVGYPKLLNVLLMNGLFSGAAARAALRSAYACLAELHDTIGASGLAAADGNPGLMAAVDQHAAGIRDSLTADVRPL